MSIIGNVVKSAESLCSSTWIDEWLKNGEKVYITRGTGDSAWHADPALNGHVKLGNCRTDSNSKDSPFIALDRAKAGRIQGKTDGPRWKTRAELAAILVFSSLAGYWFGNSWVLACREENRVLEKAMLSVLKWRRDTPSIVQYICLETEKSRDRKDNSLIQKIYIYKRIQEMRYKIMVKIYTSLLEIYFIAVNFCSFCCTVKWIRSIIYLWFLIFFSIIVYHRILNIFPYAIQ